MAESRGRVEDEQLKQAYQVIYNVGTQWRGADYFQKTLTSSKIKLKPKLANIAGLQLADLLAYPIKQEVLIDEQRIANNMDNFGTQICRLIKSKYNQQIYEGRIRGYGKIFLG